MERVAKLELDGKSYEFPVIQGTESELAFDISNLRDSTGYITLDDGYGNTGACRSAITFIDGDKGILRHRGIPIEQLAEHSSFVETAYLVIWGHLPSAAEHAQFSSLLTKHSPLHEGLKTHFSGFPVNAPPMAILSAMINALFCYHPDLMKIQDSAHFQDGAARLISKVRTIAAAAYKMSIGRPMIHPMHNLKYADNFLHMMFSEPYNLYEADPDISRALNLFLLLHADHEQNCSTSTVRMVASSGANLFTSCAAGVSALWGPLHGGANVAVIDMLEEIRNSGITTKEFIRRIKDKDSRAKLMGFGHRVYKNFDPRSTILHKSLEKILNKTKKSDPLLDIAQELADTARSDDYFISRKLYPNVDFYSGMVLRSIGIPKDMFTVMFAIGRMPGWIANWKEIHDNPKQRINRPRQIYSGPALRDYVPREKRG